jgi:hypothetical protein
MEANVKEYNNLFKKKRRGRVHFKKEGSVGPQGPQNLVSKIIPYRKTCIDGSLRKGSGHRKL